MSISDGPSLAVLALALLMDATLGEPPRQFHPVVLMGKTITGLERLAPPSGASRQFLMGAFIALATPSLFAAAAAAMLAATTRWPAVGTLISAMFLKSTFALRALGRAAGDVRDPLCRGDLDGGRAALRSLCSRDASLLDERLLVAASVESVAENASDSFVAPLFYFLVLGVPGAVFYRVANTADAMIGYRGRYEYVGKVAARLDDALNFIPARLTAALLLVAGWLSGRDVRHAWRVLRRDAGRTESPNAGKPMAAIAGLLRVELEKVGQYRLGDGLEPLTVSKIDEAWRVVRLAAGLASGFGMAALAISHAGAR
jgi:adenosylcobinamide-phosphate synthase